MSRSRAVVPHVELGQVVERLADPSLARSDRAQQLARLSAGLAAGVRGAGARALVGGRYLADTVSDLAPQVPVRDLLALREHHHGLSGRELAEELVAVASRVTAGVGAAGGALSAAQLVAPPTLLAAPVQVAAETVAVVLVELKLTAELHVVFGRAAPGTPAQQGAAYLQAWVAKKGLEPGLGIARLGTVVATAARQQLRARLVRRFGRNLSTMAPFLAGAVAGAELNRRETRTLGAALISDLAPRR